MDPLDNPIWHALCGPQATLAEGTDHARRYRPEYAEFSALADDAPPTAWDDLAGIVGAGGYALVLPDVEPPAGWKELERFPVRQMVLAADLGEFHDDRIELLDDRDAAAMAVLVRATEPGPWRARTHELGDYVGVRVDGRLVALAGQRMRLPDAIEISAVCTDPAFRGRGYARAAVAEVAARAARTGAASFLHVRDENEAAIRVYEGLGFRTRARFDPGIYLAPTG